MFELKQSCRACGKGKPAGFTEQWWNCQNYFGFSGLFCSRCYEKISHNSYKEPNHPKEYLMMLLKYGMK